MKRRLIILTVILLCVPDRPGQTESPPNAALGLSGITGIEVLVDELSPDIESLGLQTHRIANAVEDQVRHAGIRIFTRRDRQKDSKGAALFVRVNTQHDRIGRYFFCLELQVKRSVNIEGIETPIEAWVWETPTRITAVADDKVKEIGPMIQKEVQTFLQDYRSVNGKGRS